MNKRLWSLIIAWCLWALSQTALAETVFVKYHGVVDLKSFECTQTESSFVHRICYDAPNQYLIVLLHNTYYHYCRLPTEVYEQWLSAGSKGKFYGASIKGQFDCRLGGIPDNK